MIALPGQPSLSMIHGIVISVSWLPQFGKKNNKSTCLLLSAGLLTPESFSATYKSYKSVGFLSTMVNISPAPYSMRIPHLQDYLNATVGFVCQISTRILSLQQSLRISCAPRYSATDIAPLSSRTTLYQRNLNTQISIYLHRTQHLQ